MEETRVVLVKPGDVLMIGNVGEMVRSEDMAELAAGLKKLGLPSVAFFAGDIQLDRVTAEQLRLAAGG